MKRTLRVAALIALFLFGFVLFLFLTFPYEVMKESLTAELSQASGYRIRIGDLSPDLPLGLEAKKLRIESPSGTATLNLDNVSVNIRILPFLIGKLGVSAVLEQGKGEFGVNVNFSVFDLIAKNFVPGSFDLESRDFPLDQLVSFALVSASSGPGANPMLAPILSAIGVSGLLNSKAEFKLDSKNPTQSKGELDVSLKNAVLKLSHPSLGLPDQTFKKAQIKAKVDNGQLVFDKNSGFVSDELSLLIEGKITLKPQPTNSQLDTKVQIKLDKGLKEKFGFIMDAVTGSSSSDGQLTMQLRGPIEQPAVTTF